MDLVHLGELLRGHEGAPLRERSYRELQRSAELSTGVYLLPAGQPDPQQPHAEDEVYYVIRGQGRLVVGEESQPVGPGSLAFVPAHAPHRFTDVTEDLVLLLVFAPPYKSRAPRA